MRVYDLDLNEQIDIIKVGGKEYKIGDIPPSYIKEILNIPTVLSSDNAFYFKWVEIIEKILKLKNKEIKIKEFTSKHILQMITLISNRINND